MVCHHREVYLRSIYQSINSIGIFIIQPVIFNFLNNLENSNNRILNFYTKSYYYFLLLFSILSYVLAFELSNDMCYLVYMHLILVTYYFPLFLYSGKCIKNILLKIYLINNKNTLSKRIKTTEITTFEI